MTRPMNKANKCHKITFMLMFFIIKMLKIKKV